MATPAQIEANRRNALKSTGPRTDAGKARSALNARLHGLAAAHITTIDESAETYRLFRARIVAELAPRRLLETMLAEQVAQNLWRLHRIASVEGAAIERTARFNPGRDAEPGTGVHEAVLRNMAMGSPTLLKLQIYQMRLERALQRCLAELRQLKKEPIVELEESIPDSSTIEIPGNPDAEARDEPSLPEAEQAIEALPEAGGQFEQTNPIPNPPPLLTPASAGRCTPGGERSQSQSGDAPSQLGGRGEACLDAAQPAGGFAPAAQVRVSGDEKALVIGPGIIHSSSGTPFERGGG